MRRTSLAFRFGAIGLLPMTEREPSTSSRQHVRIAGNLAFIYTVDPACETGVPAPSRCGGPVGRPKDMPKMNQTAGVKSCYIKDLDLTAETQLVSERNQMKQIVSKGKRNVVETYGDGIFCTFLSRSADLEKLSVAGLIARISLNARTAEKITVEEFFCYSQRVRSDNSSNTKTC